MSCAPKKMPPGYFAKLGPCEQLALYEEAAFALSTGQKRKVIRHGEFFTEYAEGSLPFITREIARLRAICGRRSAITIGRTPGCDPARPYDRYRRF